MANEHQAAESQRPAVASKRSVPKPNSASRPLGRLIDRIFDRRPAVRRAALRRTDQDRHVLPTACVRSGVQTDHAVRVRAVESARSDAWVIAIGQSATATLFGLLRRPVFAVTLPVAEAAWRTWRGRLKVSMVLVCAGIALCATGVIRGIGGMTIVGAVLIALGWLNRVRAWHNAWVAVEYRSAAAEVVVSRVHSAFDAEAKAIYSRSVFNQSKRPRP